MFVVGLAGQIASGKSTVAEVWRSSGAVVISGDELGRQAVESAPRVKRQLVRAFGKAILNRRGALDRRKLAARAFADEAATAILNRIVHPKLLQLLRERIRAQRRRRTQVLIIDAALLLDWNLRCELDFIIVIESPIPDQLRRLRAKGLSATEARLRIRRQMPKYRQRQAADIVIRNNRSESDLKRRAAELWARIISMAANKKS